jgi:hypothetical protein
MLAQIRSANFRNWVRPGETAEITASITSSQDAVATAKCHIDVAGKRVASAELMFAFAPHSLFAVSQRDDLLDAFLSQGDRGAKPEGAR